MELEIFWGVVTLIGIFLSNKFKSSFKQFMGPMLIGFTGCLWVAYNGDSNAGHSNGAHRGEDDSRGNTDAQRITAKQHKYILSLCLEQGISKAQIKQHCLEAYGAVVNYLTRADASSLIEHLLSR